MGFLYFIIDKVTEPVRYLRNELNSSKNSHCPMSETVLRTYEISISLMWPHIQTQTACVIVKRFRIFAVFPQFKIYFIRVLIKGNVKFNFLRRFMLLRNSERLMDELIG